MRLNFCKCNCASQFRPPPIQRLHSNALHSSEINMINEWLCDMSHCCHQMRFWALNATKMRSLGRGSTRIPLGELAELPRPISCVWGGCFVAGKGRGREGKGGKGEWEGREGEGWEGREMDPRNFENRLMPMKRSITQNNLKQNKNKDANLPNLVRSTSNHSVLSSLFVSVILDPPHYETKKLT